MPCMVPMCLRHWTVPVHFAMGKVADATVKFLLQSSLGTTVLLTVTEAMTATIAAATA